MAKNKDLQPLFSTGCHFITFFTSKVQLQVCTIKVACTSCVHTIDWLFCIPVVGSSNSPYRAQVMWFMRDFEVSGRALKNLTVEDKEIFLCTLNYDANIDLETVIEKCEVSDKSNNRL